MGVVLNVHTPTQEIALELSWWMEQVSGNFWEVVRERYKNHHVLTFELLTSRWYEITVSTHHQVASDLSDWLSTQSSTWKMCNLLMTHLWCFFGHQFSQVLLQYSPTFAALFLSFIYWVRVVSFFPFLVLFKVCVFILFWMKQISQRMRKKSNAFLFTSHWLFACILFSFVVYKLNE